MIFSSVHANDDCSKYPKAIQTAIAYLKAHDFMKMEPGRYGIQGDEIYAMVSDAVTAPAAEKKPEAHKKYVDVQYLVSGKERLGFTPDNGSYEVESYAEEKDLILYKQVENECYILAAPGCYSIFFPNDIHRPGVAAGEPATVRKVVVKVSVDLI